MINFFFQCWMIVKSFQSILRNIKKFTKKSQNAKMRNDDIDFYARFFKIEFLTAFYLNYKNIAEFRKFKFSSIVLEWYLYYAESCIVKNSKIAFELLRNLFDIETVFSEITDELRIRYSISDVSEKKSNNKTITNQDYRYADLLYDLTQDIEHFSDWSTDFQRHFEFSYQFEKFMKKIIFSIKISSVNIIKLKYSILDLFAEYNEQFLKKYSRMNALIKSLQCQLTSKKWKQIFVNVKKSSFQFRMINSDHIFKWMKFTIMKKKFNIYTMFTSAKRTRKNYFFILNLNVFIRTNAILREHQRFLKYDERRLFSKNVISDRDSTDYHLKKMWKNAFWRQFHFQNLSMNFVIIQIANVFKSIQKKLIYDINNSKNVVFWFEILTFFAIEKNQKFKFIYILHVVKKKILITSISNFFWTFEMKLIFSQTKMLFS